MTDVHSPRYTPAKQNPLSGLDKVLPGYAKDEANSAKRTIVLYVHGRGNEPKKSFGDTLFTSGFVLEKLEQQGVWVLGFTWPSKIAWAQLCDRPVAEAKRSATEFQTLLDDIEVHRKAHRGYWQGRRLVLLAHSMGNILVGQALSDEDTARKTSRVFDTVILSAADSPVVGHAVWQAKMTAGKTYVLSNPNDRFLLRSMRCEGAKAEPRLGLNKIDDQAMRRNIGTTYIEVPAGDRHRYILRGAQEGNPHICHAVRDLLSGKRPAFPADWVVGTDPLLVKIPKKVDRSNACFKGRGNDDKESDMES